MWNPVAVAPSGHKGHRASENTESRVLDAGGEALPWADLDVMVAEEAIILYSRSPFTRTKTAYVWKQGDFHPFVTVLLCVENSVFLHQIYILQVKGSVDGGGGAEVYT